jgi:hypothetical protein
VTVKTENMSGGASAVRADKIVVDTSGRVEGVFSLAEAFKATKLTFTLVDAQRTADEDKHAVKLAVEHRAAWGTVFAEADLLKYNLALSALSGAEGALFGASVDYGLAAGVKDYSPLLGYSAKGITVGLVAAKGKGKDAKPCDSLELSYFQVRATPARARRGKEALPRGAARATPRPLPPLSLAARRRRRRRSTSPPTSRRRRRPRGWRA